MVWRQIFCKLFVEEHYNKLTGINQMGLSVSRANFFDIISLQAVKRYSGINLMGISYPLADYKINYYYQKWKFNKQPYNVTQKNCKGWTHWDLVPLRPTIKTKNYSQIWTFNKQPYVVTQNNCKGLTQWYFFPLGTNIKNKQIFVKMKIK